MVSLTFENLKILSSSNQSSQKAKILVDVISNDYMRNSDDLYLINKENMTLELIDRSRSQNVIIKVIQDLYFNADEKLTDDQKTILKTKDFMNYSKLSNINTIKSIIQNIDELLFKNLEENDTNKIHFQNGYIKIDTGKLYKRTKPVKDYIKRDYKKASKQDIEFVNKIYAQIYPVEDERNYILSTIGSSITGQSKKDRNSLFLIGKSSAGKSLLMQSLNKAFSDVYVKEFSSDTFSKSNPNRNKILNEFIRLTNVRICWVNELNGKIDESLFKSFCEGQIHTCRLYTDGMTTLQHMSKIILTSNELPNIRIDTGVSSRIVSHTHRSYFTDNDSEVDEENYIYKRNNNLISEINNNDSYKNAVIDIILQHALEYLKNGLNKVPESMQNDKSEIVSGNDYMEDFIDAKLEYKEDGKIAKQALLNSYLEMYPKHQRSMQQMISAMKDKGIVYNFSLRVNNIKGCFIGVQFKQEANVNYVRSPDDITTINKQQIEIEYLKKQLAELQALLKSKDEVTPKKKQKNVSKKESKIEIIEPTILFSNEDLEESFNESLNDLL
jgi:hypothetical protein